MKRGSGGVGRLRSITPIPSHPSPSPSPSQYYQAGFSPFLSFAPFLISPPPPPSNKNCYTSYLQSMDAGDRYSYNPTLSWNPAVHSYFVKAYGHHRFSLISHALTYVCIISSASASFFLLLFEMLMADI